MSGRDSVAVADDVIENVELGLRVRLRHRVEHGRVRRGRVLGRAQRKLVVERRDAGRWVEPAAHHGSRLRHGAVGRMRARVGARRHGRVGHHVVRGVLLHHGLLLLVLRLAEHELLVRLVRHGHRLTGVAARTGRQTTRAHGALVGVLHGLLLRHVHVRLVRWHAHGTGRTEASSGVHACVLHAGHGALVVEIHVAGHGHVHARAPVRHVARLADVESIRTDVDVGRTLTAHYGTRVR